MNVSHHLACIMVPVWMVLLAMNVCASRELLVQTVKLTSMNVNPILVKTVAAASTISMGMYECRGTLRNHPIFANRKPSFNYSEQTSI